MLPEGKSKPRFVPTELGPEAHESDVEVVFIGEAPGEDESEQKRPFVGQAGDKLRKAVNRVVETKQYAYSNVVRCRPTDSNGKNRAPTDVEIKHCRPYLKQDLERLNPRLIVPLGATALTHATPKGLFGKTKEGKESLSITQLRGQLRESGGRKYLPVFHPSYVLRSMRDEAKWEQDLSKVQVGLARSAADTPFMNKGKVVHLDTLKKVLSHLRFLRKEHAGLVALDIESESLNRVAPNRVLSVQFSHTIEEAYVVLLDHVKNTWTSDENARIKKELRKLFTRSKKIKAWVTHNGKFDYDKLATLLSAKRWAAPIVDTMFMAHLLDDNRAGDNESGIKTAGYKLKTLEKEWLNYHHRDEETLEARESGYLERLPLNKFLWYAGEDAYVTLRMFQYILQQAEREGYKNKLLRMAISWGARMLTMIPTMERWGFYIDKRQLALLSSSKSPVRKRVAELEKELYAMDVVRQANEKLCKGDGRTAGMQSLFGGSTWLFDLNKKESLETICFDVLKLKALNHGKPTPKWPKGAPAIDKAFMAEYAPDEKTATETGRKRHPFVVNLQEWRGLAKLETAYVNNIRALLFEVPDNGDGRVRASFWITRTVTGRWACSDPNLQQAARPEEFDPKNPTKIRPRVEVRNIFRAAPGYVLLEADYGQAEIRWWAHISKDKKFIESFKKMAEIEELARQNPHDEALQKRVKNECDIHRQVASLMFNTPINDVTKDQRQAAKSLAFGSIYGQHYKTLARILKKTPEEALGVQNQFLSAFPRAGNWLTAIQTETQGLGYVESPMGRRRRLRELYASNDDGLIQAANRRARNSPIQAQSSDTTALAAWLMVEYIQTHNKKWKLINVVHDALMLEVPLVWSELQEATRVIRDIMSVQVIALLKRDFDVEVEVPFSVDYKLGLKWGELDKADDLRAAYEKLKAAHKAEVKSGWCPKVDPMADDERMAA